jgi:hypothetical protein
LHSENALEYFDDKLHRREIVVNENHPVQRWFLQAGPRLFNGQVMAGRVLGLIATLTHKGSIW